MIAIFRTEGSRQISNPGQSCAPHTKPFRTFCFRQNYRAPKIAEPTRTLVAPKATAIS